MTTFVSLCNNQANKGSNLLVFISCGDLVNHLLFRDQMVRLHNEAQQGVEIAGPGIQQLRRLLLLYKDNDPGRPIDACVNRLLDH